MARIALFFLPQLLFLTGYATTGYPVRKDKLIIQHISIQDKELRQHIEAYIERVKHQNTLFRNGLGFVVLENLNAILPSGRPLSVNDIRADQTSGSGRTSTMNISVQAYPLFPKLRYDCISCNYYPPYYTIISGKLVFIYETNLLALQGKRAWNDTHNSHMFQRNSLKKLSRLVNKMALIDLPDDYVFDDFIEKGMTLSRIKERAKNRDDILKFYEFIDFKASERIVYDIETYSYKKE